jgi:hypothetical protein
MTAQPTYPADDQNAKRIRRNWIIAILVAVVVLLAAIGVGVFFFVMSLMKGSDVYREALARMNANALATQVLGAPIEAGFPMGKIQISGPSGEAELSIPVTGSARRGTIYLEATKEMGKWRYDRIELEVEGRDERIDLGSATTPKGRRGKGTEALDTTRDAWRPWPAAARRTLPTPPRRTPPDSMPRSS